MSSYSCLGASCSTCSPPPGIPAGGRCLSSDKVTTSVTKWNVGLHFFFVGWFCFVSNAAWHDFTLQVDMASPSAQLLSNAVVISPCTLQDKHPDGSCFLRPVSLVWRTWVGKCPWSLYLYDILRQTTPTRGQSPSVLFSARNAPVPRSPRLSSAPSPPPRRALASRVPEEGTGGRGVETRVRDRKRGGRGRGMKVLPQPTQH